MHIYAYTEQIMHIVYTFMHISYAFMHTLFASLETFFAFMRKYKDEKIQSLLSFCPNFLR